MSSAKSEFGSNSSDAVDVSNNLIHDLKPREYDSSHLDVASDTKWLSQKYGHEKAFFHKQVNILDEDANLCSGCVGGSTKLSGDNKLMEDYCTTYHKHDAAFCLDQPLKDFHYHAENDQDGWMKELDAMITNNLHKIPESKVIEEFWPANARQVDLDPCNCVVFEQPKKLSFDLDSHWVGVEKIEPWWHTPDKGDLASLVSQQSFQHIKNSDLPKHQSKHFEKGSAHSINCFNPVKEQIANKETMFSDVAATQGDLASTSMDMMLGQKGSDGTLSNIGGSIAAKVDFSDTQQQASTDLSRDQLLEALCHSQTRAREAEKWAQEACDDKEHIINLFFRQASYLFAYRQWLQILQLETVCLQLRNKNLLNSTTFLPWAKRNGRLMRKKRPRAAKMNPRKQSCNINKCAAAFALGLSLAGAGLLVGWTVGWLFRAF